MNGGPTETLLIHNHQTRTEQGLAGVPVTATYVRVLPPRCEGSSLALAGIE